MITATQIRAGQILKIDQKLLKVIKVQHITPGKGNAVIQAELRNIKTGNKDNIRFRSTETVEIAEVSTRNVNFLYEDAAIYHFMDPVTFEQLELNADILGEVISYLKPEIPLTVSSFEGNPVSVLLPSKINFEVVMCDPPAKGIAGTFKEAQLENGLKTKVPLFIKIGDQIVIDTESGDYVEKS